MKQSLVAAAALATLQVAAQAPTPPASPAGERTLNPVVVTPGLGSAQAAFDTPASVDVIRGDTLRDAQLGINLSESLQRVPGISVLNRQNYAQDLQISSRGYGARSTFGVRGLRLYTDGIPATAPDGQSQVSHFDLLSADRIEVLRGPFSALYGNSSGGVLSLFTADGGPQTVAELGTAFGSNGTRRHNVRLSGQEGRIQYNLSATTFDTDGWREHSAAQRTGFNGKVRYSADEDTRVTVVLNHVNLPDVQDPLALERRQYERDPRQAPLAEQFNTRKSVEQLQAGAILEHRVDRANSLKVTGWRGQRSTEQFQAIPPANQVLNSSGGVIDLARDYQGLDAQWVHRAQLLGSPLTLTGGLYADELEERRKGFLNFLGPAAAPTQLGVLGPLRRDEDNRVRSFDQYLQAVWTRARVSVTAGLRHSTVKFASRDRFIQGTNGDDSGSARYSATTPVLGVVLHATERLNLYASAGRGFETPTSNELSYRPLGVPGLNFDLRSADSRQWELGAKAQLAERWHGNLALFQARTDDEIVVFSNNGGRSTFQNAGRTERKGLEAALAGDLGAGFTAALAATWLQAQYDTGFLTCVAAGCTAATRQAVAAGNRIPGVPARTAFAELAWRHRPLGLLAAVELRHVGRIYANDLNDESAERSTTANVRVSLSQPLGRWTLSEFLRVDNVTDRQYVGSVIVNEGNRRYYESAPGRTWLVGVNAAYRF
ncbi:MAG TPA: TonB-dependent receptor [Ramlibacter sp.]|jgi:iron complex outermembrane receptor protein|uniref:TonB-dependent receptor family protein n=1 Tax=Ramlibacter sp. TaxID=1917967 RepID=UPI002D288CF6|nr:TonB-dependent receptor [Ramlibacter sp.]HZY20460.1 TonB-dependent receptor [Ramlibacter sp.]